MSRSVLILFCVVVRAMARSMCTSIAKIQVVLNVLSFLISQTSLFSLEAYISRIQAVRQTNGILKTCRFCIGLCFTLPKLFVWRVFISTQIQLTQHKMSIVRLFIHVRSPHMNMGLYRCLFYARVPTLNGYTKQKQWQY